LIIEDPKSPWIRILPSSRPPFKRVYQTDEEYFEHYGKWMTFRRDPNIFDELARKIEPYIERGEIDLAKYNRKPSLPCYDTVVMFVYCDDRDKEEVRKILNKFGVTGWRWKYEWKTYVDWLPGGRLYEKAKEVGHR